MYCEMSDRDTQQQRRKRASSSSVSSSSQTAQWLGLPFQAQRDYFIPVGIEDDDLNEDWDVDQTNDQQSVLDAERATGHGHGHEHEDSFSAKTPLSQKSASRKATSHEVSSPSFTLTFGRKQESDDVLPPSAITPGITSERELHNLIRNWKKEIEVSRQKGIVRSRVKTLFFERGIPSSLRADIWEWAIGDKLNITRKLYRALLREANGYIRMRRWVRQCKTWMGLDKNSSDTVDGRGATQRVLSLSPVKTTDDLQPSTPHTNNVAQLESINSTADGHWVNQSVEPPFAGDREGQRMLRSFGRASQMDSPIYISDVGGRLRAEIGEKRNGITPRRAESPQGAETKSFTLDPIDDLHPISGLLNELTQQQRWIGSQPLCPFIDKDVSRTLRRLRFFDAEAELYNALRRIVFAYCWYRPDFEYLQGFLYLPAMLLLHLKDRRDLNDRVVPSSKQSSNLIELNSAEHQEIAVLDLYNSEDELNSISRAESLEFAVFRRLPNVVFSEPYYSVLKTCNVPQTWLDLMVKMVHRVVPEIIDTCGEEADKALKPFFLQSIITCGGQYLHIDLYTRICDRLFLFGMLEIVPCIVGVLRAWADTAKNLTFESILQLSAFSSFETLTEKEVLRISKVIDNISFSRQEFKEALELNSKS